MGKIIITGANGFIGKHLIRSLTQEGYNVIALDINFSEEVLKNELVLPIKCDLFNLSDIDIPEGEYEAIIHLLG